MCCHPQPLALAFPLENNTSVSVLLFTSNGYKKITYSFDMSNLYKLMIECQDIRVMVRHSMRMAFPINP